MSVAALEPISPELVLVSSPEEARRARELLPPAPPSTLDLLAARLRERPVAVPAPVRARSRGRRLVLAGVLVLLLAAATAAWIERPRPLRPSFATSTTGSRPVHRDAVLAAATTVEAASAPPAGSFVPARVWVWSSDARATAYRFELALNGRIALSLRTEQPRLVLPRSFRFRAGAYRWSVRPIPNGTGLPLTDSRFTLTRAAAALANR